MTKGFLSNLTASIVSVELSNDHVYIYPNAAYFELLECDEIRSRIEACPISMQTLRANPETVFTLPANFKDLALPTLSDI